MKRTGNFPGKTRGNKDFRKARAPRKRNPENDGGKTDIQRESSADTGSAPYRRRKRIQAEGSSGAGRYFRRENNEGRDEPGKGFRSRSTGNKEQSSGTGRYFRRETNERRDEQGKNFRRRGTGNKERSSGTGRYFRRENNEGGDEQGKNFRSRSTGNKERSSGTGRYFRRENNEGGDERGKGFRSRSTGRKEPSSGSGRYFSREDNEGGDEQGKNFRRRGTGNKERSSGTGRYFRRENNEGGEEKGKGFRSRSTGSMDQPSGSGRKWNRKEDHEFYGQRKSGKESYKRKPVKENDGLTRLNKFIANAGICSRREADELIEAGVISVNGKVVTQLGYKIQPGDTVKYNNEVLRGERMVYILLNKPKDFITTTDDPENRKTVMNLIAKACRERVYPVGRLDRNTTGVLMFTNDGDLADKLTHPSFQVHKVYQVELDKGLKPGDMQQVREGVQLDDGFIKVDEIAWLGSDKNILGVEIHSGKNRIVRRIFEHLDYKIRKLDRVVFAGLTKKDLPRGRWRFLTEMEIASLKMMTGSRKKTVPAT